MEEALIEDAYMPIEPEYSPMSPQPPYIPSPDYTQENWESNTNSPQYMPRSPPLYVPSPLYDRNWTPDITAGSPVVGSPTAPTVVPYELYESMRTTKKVRVKIWDIKF